SCWKYDLPSSRCSSHHGDEQRPATNGSRWRVSGRFIYRLHVIPITIPPLRERPEDISLLAFHFIKQLNEQYEKNHHLSPDAIRLLEAYSWPGNIRELQNFIERLV